MSAALMAMLCFTISALFAARSAYVLGSIAANFWRLVVAASLLGLVAHLVGHGLGGAAFLWFFISGLVGFGLADLCFFASLPYVGVRLTTLIINCVSAPIAAVIERFWLGTSLTQAQIILAGIIILGVSLAIDPRQQNLAIKRAPRSKGVLFALMSSLGQALGAVLSRKAFSVAAAEGVVVDGFTAAYQRVLGGLVFATIVYLLWSRSVGPHTQMASKIRIRLGIFYVVFNGIFGPTLGVAFYQLALRTTPSGIVLPIIAMTPLSVMPLTYLLDKDRPTKKAVIGSLLAVIGVVCLALQRSNGS